MEKLMKRVGNSDLFIVDSLTVSNDANGYTGEAINKLAKFENIYEELIASQSEISNQLQKLRDEKKTKTVRFRELMGKKMTNAMTIELFRSYGLK